MSVNFTGDSSLLRNQLKKIMFNYGIVFAYMVVGRYLYISTPFVVGIEEQF
ncbi:hypothetical protein [Methylomonas albis]|nr:hypothetical protein [Methylomonas albis]